MIKVSQFSRFDRPYLVDDTVEQEHSIQDLRNRQPCQRKHSLVGAY